MTKSAAAVKEVGMEQMFQREHVRPLFSLAKKLKKDHGEGFSELIRPEYLARVSLEEGVNPLLALTDKSLLPAWVRFAGLVAFAQWHADEAGTEVLPLGDRKAVAYLDKRMEGFVGDLWSRKYDETYFVSSLRPVGDAQMALEPLIKLESPITGERGEKAWLPGVGTKDEDVWHSFEADGEDRRFCVRNLSDKPIYLGTDIGLEVVGRDDGVQSAIFRGRAMTSNHHGSGLVFAGAEMSHFKNGGSVRVVVREKSVDGISNHLVYTAYGANGINLDERFVETAYGSLESNRVTLATLVELGADNEVTATGPSFAFYEDKSKWNGTREVELVAMQIPEQGMGSRRAKRERVKFPVVRPVLDLIMPAYDGNQDRLDKDRQYNRLHLENLHESLVQAITVI